MDNQRIPVFFAVCLGVRAFVGVIRKTPTGLVLLDAQKTPKPNKTYKKLR
jgi:hypothetical protein